MEKRGKVKGKRVRVGKREGGERGQAERWEGKRRQVGNARMGDRGRGMKE